MSTLTPGLGQLAALASAQPLSPTCDHFYFLRHGQTNCNASRIFQSAEEPLSVLGLEQAATAAALLAGEPIRSIVCSDMNRAFVTASTVAGPLGLTPQPRAGLRERHFGELIGSSSANIDWSCDPAGGESLASFVDRKRPALDAALEATAPVLVVAHGGTLYVLAALLGVPIDETLIGNAQPLRFSQRDGHWTVRALLPRTGGESAIA